LDIVASLRNEEADQAESPRGLLLALVQTDQGEEHEGEAEELKRGVDRAERFLDEL